MATLADSFLDDLDELGESSGDEQEEETDVVASAGAAGLEEAEGMGVSLGETQGLTPPLCC